MKKALINEIQTYLFEQKKAGKPEVAEATDFWSQEQM